MSDDKKFASDSEQLKKRAVELFRGFADRILYKSSLSAPEPDPEPEFDIAICSQCGWRGPVSECETGEEGDWESGYYKIDLCPRCEDGGCIDNYDMSPVREKEWEAWAERNPVCDCGE